MSQPYKVFRVAVVSTEQLDVEFVLHGDTGPASSWAGLATPGDRLAIVAPNADHESIQGYEYVQPANTDWTLIAGDRQRRAAGRGAVRVARRGVERGHGPAAAPGQRARDRQGADLLLGLLASW